MAKKVISDVQIVRVDKVKTTNLPFYLPFPTYKHDVLQRATYLSNKLLRGRKKLNETDLLNILIEANDIPIITASDVLSHRYTMFLCHNRNANKMRQYVKEHEPKIVAYSLLFVVLSYTNELNKKFALLKK